VKNRKKKPKKKKFVVVNKKRELLPDLSPTFPCLFALPLFNFSKSKRFVQKYKSASLSICILIIEIRKNLKPVKVIS